MIQYFCTSSWVRIHHVFLLADAPKNEVVEPYEEGKSRKDEDSKDYGTGDEKDLVGEGGQKHQREDMERDCNLRVRI